MLANLESIRGIAGFRKSRLFKRFILSYVIILVIPLCLIGIFLFNAFTKSLEDEIKNSTQINLGQIMDTMDMRLQEMDYISVQLSENKNIAPLLYAQDPNQLTEYQFYTLIRELKNYRATNAFFDNIFLYFRKSNVIVGGDSKYSLPIFFSEVYRYNKMFESDFKMIMDTSLECNVRPVEQVYSGTSMKELITYIRPIPITDMPRATLMVTMNVSIINKITKNILGSFSGKVYILDGQDKIISVVGNGKSEKDIIETLPKFEGTRIFEKYSAEKKQMIFKSTSSKSGWSYIAVIPSAEALAKVNIMRLWAWAIIALSIVIGIALAYYFAYGNYYPVKRMIDMVYGNIKSGDDAKKTYGNELDIISSVISATMTKNIDLEKRMNEQIPILRANFFLRLIQGSYIDSKGIESMAEFTGIGELQGPFKVMLLSINDYAEFTDKNSETMVGTYKFSIANVVEELCSNFAKIYTVDLSEIGIAAIINFQGKSLDYTNKLLTVGHEVKDFFEKNFDFTLTVGIGRAYNTITEISKSYVEAKAAVDYKMVKGKNTVILFENITTEGDERSYYSHQSERKIFEYLKKGDFDGISGILLKIINNVNSKPVTINMARCIYFEIINTAMKSLGELNSEDYNEIIHQGNVLPNLLECETLNELYEETGIFYKIICERIKKNVNNKSSDFENNILEYIHKNFDDNNISLTSIAESFDVTPSYLSRFFKNRLKCNFVDYIHKLRSERAKELLVSTNMSIAEIADESGYFDSHSLIRSFKKYEGLTPGRFRDVNKQK